MRRSSSVSKCLTVKDLRKALFSEKKKTLFHPLLPFYLWSAHAYKSMDSPVIVSSYIQCITVE